MNKLIIALAIFSYSFASFGACPKGAESGKTILFFDLNDNPREIESTKRAACKRGESVIVLPEKGKQFNSEELYRLLGSFEKNKVSVNSLVISGHDGGGQFGGTNGFFSKQMLSEIIENFPESRDSVSSVLLLGCYTGVKQEIFDWKQILPNANLIAGYEGQAPLGDKPAGHSYIEGVLLKEKEMNDVKSKAELERFLKKGIKHISSISAAMYIHPKICAPGTEHESGFYFRPLKGKDSLQDLVTQECLRIKVGEGPLMLSKFMAYYRGEKEIPEQTHSTELRMIYNFFRENGHCFEGDQTYPTADKVLFTLFFDGVKKNYAHHNEELFNQFAEETEKFVESFDKHFDNYVDEKTMLIKILKERADIAEKTYGEELAFFSREYMKLYSSISHNLLPGPNFFEQDTSKLTPEEMEIYKRMQAYNVYARYLSQMSYMQQVSGRGENLNPEHLKLAAEKFENFLANKEDYRVSLKSSVEKFEPPTKEFIESASRAEILAKAHEVSKFNGLEIFVNNVSNGNIVQYSLNDSLVSLNCIPFEWHEYNEISRRTPPGCGGIGGEAGGGGEDEDELDTIEN